MNYIKPCTLSNKRYGVEGRLKCRSGKCDRPTGKSAGVENARADRGGEKCSSMPYGQPT